jgi:lipopolysaccharide transport system ATP-binding protein
MSTVIEVDDVWKKYRLGVIGTGTLRHDFERWWHRVRGKPDPHAKVGEPAKAENGKSKSDLGSSQDFSISDDEVWALRGISFDVKQGEILGIVGRNGAGKSTLLKILSRVTSPTKGEVRVKGRIASLLEVGTGFHPELTGRENIFLNGAILGMTKPEIRSKLDEIVAFAGTETYIDTPVKRYSSGMYVRLAFAVAAHLEPEILIVDEVLAVGDAEFQKKCLGKMQDVSRGGRTILFVSHNMAAIQQLCTAAIMLRAGTGSPIRSPNTIVDDYLRRQIDLVGLVDLAGLSRPDGEGSRLRFTRLVINDGEPVVHGEPCRFDVDFTLSHPVTDLQMGIGFSGLDGTRYVTYDSHNVASEPQLTAPGTHRIRLEIDHIDLQPALYALDIGARSGTTASLDYVPSAAQIEVLPGATTPPHIGNFGPGLRLSGRWIATVPTAAVQR